MDKTKHFSCLVLKTISIYKNIFRTSFKRRCNSRQKLLWVWHHIVLGGRSKNRYQLTDHETSKRTIRNQIVTSMEKVLFLSYKIPCYSVRTMGCNGFPGQKTDLIHLWDVDWVLKHPDMTKYWQKIWIKGKA